MSERASTVATPLLAAEGICKTFKTPRDELHVLQGMELQVARGEMLGIVGASGVGKSTLLHILGGLDRPDAGRILFMGKSIFQQKNGYLENFRNRHVGFVFQMFNLLGDFSALENVMFPALIGGESKSIAQGKAERLLEGMGLKDRMQHKPGELSGGETQRVALARGLINEPDLTLADEPTGNLDAKAGAAFMELIQKLNADLNHTFIFVTHSQKLASQMDRVLQLTDGKLKPLDENITL
ncbi:MAG: ABC transporter ATP-binding protein [Candidatus Nitrohelix vancouverensis]|uniref:ABC transporter ATP-binding protein n=1 Tax=Candidatus Nitrohelix vancouverensis TaxID=2705534 RepID=A0A7T0C520_9BACT|nr:MAG: ABC transporter ATP-binding protein [Candidatus Nitrohelix vancouverensis]